MKVYSRVEEKDLAVILSFYRSKGYNPRSISYLIRQVISDAAKCLLIDGLAEPLSEQEARSILEKMTMLPPNLPINVMSAEEKDLYNELKDV